MAFVNMAKTLSLRFLFLMHSLIIKYTVQAKTLKQYLWLFTIFDLALVIDGMVIVYKRRGREWTWFYPSFLFYLISVLPEVWIMQIHENKILQRISNEVNFNAYFVENIVKYLICHPVVYILIIGRWLLSRGQRTRQDLLEFMFVYFSITSDIVQFSDFFSMKALVEPSLNHVMLSLWSISFLQFIFPFISLEKRDGGGGENWESDCFELPVSCQPEVVSLVVLVAVQDIPFLVFRVYIMYSVRDKQFTSLFFVVKNVLVIVLATYKLVVGHCNFLHRKHEAKVGTDRTASENGLGEPDPHHVSSV